MGATGGDEQGEQRKRVVRLIKQRSLAIGVSNLLLCGTAALSLRLGYREHLSISREVEFYLEELVVFLGLLFLYLGLKAAHEFRGAFVRDATEVSGDAASPPRLPYYILVIVIFFGLLILNFIAVGRLVIATGGIVGSPYTSFVFSMVVLGQVMANKNLTIIIIGVLGGLFIASLVTPLLGAVNEDISGIVRHLPGHFLFVGLVNLGMSSIVNTLGRPEAVVNGDGTSAVRQDGLSPADGSDPSARPDEDEARPGG